MIRRAGWAVMAGVVLADGAMAQALAGAHGNARANVGFEMSMNPAFVAEVGYDRRIADVEGKVARVHAAIATPIFLLREADSFRLGLGGSLKWVNAGRYALVTGLLTSVATSENDNGKMLAWSMKVAVSPGYYRERWFTALALSWKAAIATHITHSGYARAAFDDRYAAGAPPNDRTAGPKDGWFATPASSLTAGLVGGCSLGRATTVYFDGGISRTPNRVGVTMFGDIGVIPYYVSIGVLRHR